MVYYRPCAPANSAAWPVEDSGLASQRPSKSAQSPAVAPSRYQNQQAPHRAALLAPGRRRRPRTAAPGQGSAPQPVEVAINGTRAETDIITAAVNPSCRPAAKRQ